MKIVFMRCYVMKIVVGGYQTGAGSRYGVFSRFIVQQDN